MSYKGVTFKHVSLICFIKRIKLNEALLNKSGVHLEKME